MSLVGATQGPKQQRPISLPIRRQRESNRGSITGQRGANSRVQLRASCLPNTFEISFYRDGHLVSSQLLVGITVYFPSLNIRTAFEIIPVFDTW